MALVPGVRLGHYEIISPLGAGGMGEVYRALDTRLDRQVAVKVLPAHLAHNLEFRRRFDREARLLASISHPNICALFDVGRQDGHSYLVMEYLEGQTVAERLRSGPLAVPEALRVAIDSACGLATAHQCGVVHRDLKPANVMLTRTGVKLLDFGLARDIATAVAGMSSCEEEDTVDRQLTGQGAIVGTFHYLSPEQLLGRDADVRSDVFAFGALCYEMVTGRRAFEGDKPASIIAAVLERAPEPPRSIRSEVPASLQATIQRCLEKDPDRRWHCVADLIQELRRIEQCPGDRRRQRTTEPQPRERSAGRTAAYWFAAGALLASIAGWQLARPRAPVPVVHSSIVTPEGARFAFTGDEGGPVVLAPNQQSLAFVASLEGGERKLFVQHLASGLATPLAGTEDATFPFWSPDGRTLAFFTGGRLRRIDVAGGGPPVDVCRVGLSARGGSWGANGTIILSPDWNEGIYRVDASGGEPVAVTRVDRASQTTHRWPVLLPDGRHFIYLAANNDEGSVEHALYFASLDGTVNKRLVRSDGGATFASGRLVYADGSQLLARPLDPVSGELQGPAVVVAQDVVWDLGTWRAAFTAAGSLLAYQSGAEASSRSQLEWFDRAGHSLGAVGDRRVQFTLRLSPDARLAVSEAPGNGSGADVWITDVSAGVQRHLTQTGDIKAPIWSRDGHWVYYTKTRKSGQRGIFRSLTSGGGQPEELVLATDATTYVTDVAPGGDLVFQQEGDLWLLPPGGERTPRRLFGSPARESQGQVSGDGRWIAYTSSETGESAVYIAAFPSLAHRWQVSRIGGSGPRWRADGQELFFVSQRSSMVTSVALQPASDGLRIGEIRPLFRATLRSILSEGRPWDVTADGQRFLVNSAAPQSEPLTLVQNWPARLRPALP